MMKEMMFLRDETMKIAKYTLQIKTKECFAKKIIICHIKIAKFHHFASSFYFAMSAYQLISFLCDLKKDEEKEKERKRNKKRKNQRKE